MSIWHKPRARKFPPLGQRRVSSPFVMANTIASQFDDGTEYLRAERGKKFAIRCANERNNGDGSQERL